MEVASILYHVIRVLLSPPILIATFIAFSILYIAERCYSFLEHQLQSFFSKPEYYPSVFDFDPEDYEYCFSGRDHLPTFPSLEPLEKEEELEAGSQHKNNSDCTTSTEEMSSDTTIISLDHQADDDDIDSPPVTEVSFPSLMRRSVSLPATFHLRH